MNDEGLRRIIVGLLDLVREVQQHGHSARFAQRAPALVDEAAMALKASAPPAGGYQPPHGPDPCPPPPKRP